jgi:hypothetical protein
MNEPEITERIHDFLPGVQYNPDGRWMTTRVQCTACDYGHPVTCVAVVPEAFIEFPKWDCPKCGLRTMTWGVVPLE